MIDVETPHSPGWWTKRLSHALVNRTSGAGWSRERAYNQPDTRPGLDLLWDYYRGEAPLPKCAAGWSDGMQAVARKTRTNYTRLIIASGLQRMHPAAWRTAVDSDRDGDDVARSVAQGNGFASVAREAIEHMLVMRDGYLLVSEPRPGSDVPTITAEDPRQTITAHDPATGRSIAALKRFRDEWDAATWTYLYLPGQVFVSRSPSASVPALARSARWDEARSGPLPPALSDTVPVARLRNTGNVAEHEPHLDLIDRINEGVLDRMSIAKHQAFRQRGIRNLPTEYPDGHERAGQSIDYSDAFSADPGSLWALPEGAEIWESQPIDLGPIRMATKDDVQALVAVTATPLYYIEPDAASGSAEGASAMREAHLFRVKDRIDSADVGILDAMSIALAAMGHADRAERGALETIWGPIELHSLLERGTAAVAHKAAGLPQASIWTDIMGYDPAAIVRLEAERARDLLFADNVAATPTAPPGG